MTPTQASGTTCWKHASSAILGATANFSNSWTGHHNPSLRDNPLMFLVMIFYAMVIPGTVLFLSFLVGTDIYRQVRGR